MCRIVCVCIVGTSYIVVDNSSGLPTIRSGYPRPLGAEWPSLRHVQRLDAALYVLATSDDTAHLYLFMVSNNTYINLSVKSY